MMATWRGLSSVNPSCCGCVPASILVLGVVLDECLGDPVGESLTVVAQDEASLVIDILQIAQFEIDRRDVSVPQ